LFLRAISFFALFVIHSLARPSPLIEDSKRKEEKREALFYFLTGLEFVPMQSCSGGRASLEDVDDGAVAVSYLWDLDAAFVDEKCLPVT
jgi:hypothetical protein